MTTPMLAAAIIAALADDPVIAARANGVFLGPPLRATPPWIEVEPLQWADWSVKDAAGRELRLGLWVRDEGDDPARVSDLVDAVDAALARLPRHLPGWMLGGAQMIRVRMLREPRGWAGLVEHRLRMLADGGAAADSEQGRYSNAD